MATTTEQAEEAVAERLEFFFSDANVRQDFFIRKFLMNDEDGASKMVPVEALLRFNTIKKHTTSPEVVVEAAKTLLSDKLTVSEDGKEIGRVEPFTAAKMDENIPLSLYVSNLPIKEGEGDNEEKKYAVNADDIRALFESEIALVKLRFRRPPLHKNDDGEDDAELEPSKQQDGNRTSASPGGGKRGPRIPLGAALVEFKTVQGLEKEAAEVLTKKDGETVEPTRELKLGDSVLKVTLLKDFLDARKKNKKRKADDAEVEQQGDDKTAATTSTPNEVFTFDWKPGCVIRIKGLADGCDREAILEAVAEGLGMESHMQAREQNIYADFSRGQTDGAIRFATASDAIQTLCDKLASGEVLIQNAKIGSASILQGDEEKEYWDNFIEFKNKQLKRNAEERSSSRKRSRR